MYLSRPPFVYFFNPSVQPKEYFNVEWGWMAVGYFVNEDVVIIIYEFCIKLFNKYFDYKNVNLLYIKW